MIYPFHQDPWFLCLWFCDDCHLLRPALCHRLPLGTPGEHQEDQVAIRWEAFKNPFTFYIICPSPCSRLCSLEEQVFKCNIFCDYDAAQRLSSNSEAPLLAG